MPLVRIDLLQGRSAEYRRALGNVVHQAMVATINVPADARCMDGSPTICTGSSDCAGRLCSSA